MSDRFFFEQENFDESKLKKALQDSEKANGHKKTYANEKVLESIGQQFDFEKEKKKIIDNLNWLKKLSVEEFTFRKKWEEVKENKLYLSESGVVKSQLWSPKDLTNEKITIEEITNLQPTVVFVTTDEHQKIWNTLRMYCHTSEFNQPPGRFLKFLILDKVTGKILGFSSIASELISILCRDEKIGWKKEDRINKDISHLKNSAVCTTIAATQPFGCNFLGGKLVAALTTTETVRNAWKTYGNILVGLTTTSLYGPYSMYNGLKWWKPMGSSKGKIPIKSSEEYYYSWHQWLKQHNTEEYNRVMIQKEGISGPVTGAKMRILGMIFEAVGVKSSTYCHGFARGVYYSFIYENTKEFLCRKIEEDKLIMKPLFKEDVKGVLDWWRPRAIERYKKLKSENRLNLKKLFYNTMAGMNYEDAKTKYFNDVGK